MEELLCCSRKPKLLYKQYTIPKYIIRLYANIKKTENKCCTWDEIKYIWIYYTEICIALKYVLYCTKNSMTYTWQGTDGMWYCSDYNTHVFCSPYMCLCTVLREMSMLILLTTHTTTAWGQKVTVTNDKLFCQAAGALWCMSCKRLLPDCRLLFCCSCCSFCRRGLSASLKEANGKRTAAWNNEQKQLKCVNEYKET